MENKKIYLYFVMAYIMTILPVLNLFSFIPMYMLFRKSNIRTYLMYSGIIFLSNILLGFNFSNLTFFVVSFMWIKYLGNSKRHFDLIFLAACSIAFLMTLDFIVLKLNPQVYANYINTLKENFNQIQSYGISGFEDIDQFMKRILEFYPVYSFGIGYIASTFGYLFIYKRFFGKSNDLFFSRYIFKMNPMVFTMFILVSIFVGYSKTLFNLEINYEIKLLVYNLFFGLMFILSVQGFVIFNRILKLKMGNSIANLISFISIFLVLTYVFYFASGAINCLFRGMNNGKKTD